MRDFLHLDFETRSQKELADKNSVGLHNYWLDSTTKPLMLAYCFGQGPVKLWQMHQDSIPEDLRQGLNDPDQVLAAWNSSFERYGLKYKLNLDIPIDRWVDPQASARYLSLPGALDKVGDILALSSEFLKDKRGEDLIELFSYPHKVKKQKGEPEEWVFYDHVSHPVEWVEFCEYCCQDVRSEREIMRKEVLLGVFPLPELERKIWVFDQTVNDRGMPVDLQFVKNMHELASRSKKEAVQKQNELTGLENANSPKQMLAWAREQGYEPNTLRKETVEAQIKYHADTMTPLAIEVLTARRAASSTTYTKLAAIIRQISPDNRLRNQFLYMGSARCGRWSGNAVQLHNLARPGVLKNANGEEFNFEDEKTVNQARQMVNLMDYEGIMQRYGSVLLVVKNLIRTVFAVTR